MGVMGPMGPAGFRRRGRRRGLVVGAAVGAAAAKRGANKQQQPADDSEPAEATDTESELEELAKLKSKNLITDEEYDAKRKQILGL